MKKDEIHIDDIQRILFGQAPPVFLLEVLIRTLLIFIFLLFVVRWLGKRMSGQLTIMEMAVMLTLGAIVSVAMQIPDRGILLSMLVLICTLAFHRGLGKLGFKSARIEELTQGKMSVLVEDGILDIKEMARCRISRQQLFAQLRGKEIYNLGQVKRVYLEACGIFSIFLKAEAKPGLPILPADDQLMPDIQTAVELIACSHCGVVKKKQAKASNCDHCGSREWTEAVNKTI
jgi:uncharacterized membrane protein YcaP (DUF421 family)